MPRLDWYAFYVADYRADTRHLTPMQHFAYREIIDEIFLAGQHENPPSIPDDDEFLIGICRPTCPEEWTVTRRVLIDGPRALLSVVNGRLMQKRVTHEVEKALERAAKAKRAGVARWTHAPEPQNAVAVPKNGDSNGNGRMSDKQFLFYAGRVAKWLDEKRELYQGSSSEPGSAFARDFQRSIGITWQEWQREQQVHERTDA